MASNDVDGLEDDRHVGSLALTAPGSGSFPRLTSQTSTRPELQPH